MSETGRDHGDVRSVHVPCVKCGATIDVPFTPDEAGRQVTVQETHYRLDDDRLCYGTAVVTFPPW